LDVADEVQVILPSDHRAEVALLYPFDSAVLSFFNIDRTFNHAVVLKVTCIDPSPWRVRMFLPIETPLLPMDDGRRLPPLSTHPTSSFGGLRSSDISHKMR